MGKETTLSSLAILNANINENKDYFDLITPFILAIITENKSTPIFSNKISDKIAEQFGLIIPSTTVNYVLQIMSKKGYLEYQNSLYYASPSLPNSTYIQDKSDIERRISLVINNFIQFAKENNVIYSENESIEALINFLSKFSIDCIKSFLRGSALPVASTGSEKDIYLVSSFVTYAKKSNLELFDSFMILAQGNMLANALLCSDIESLAIKSFNDV